MTPWFERYKNIYNIECVNGYLNIPRVYALSLALLVYLGSLLWVMSTGLSMCTVVVFLYIMKKKMFQKAAKNNHLWSVTAINANCLTKGLSCLHVFDQCILLLFTCRNDLHLSAIDCTVGVQLYWLKQIPEVLKSILTLIFMGSKNI